MPNDPNGDSRQTRPETSGKQLPNEVVAALWSTPRASDAQKGSPNQAFGAGGQPLPSQAYQAAAMAARESPTHGANTPGSPEQTAKLGGLAPEFVSWLMGFPPEWLGCAPTKASMKLSRSSRAASTAGSES